MIRQAALQIATEAIDRRRAMQKPQELASLLQLLDQRPIHHVLEIGGNYGGNLWALSQIATGKLVSVDLEVLEGHMEHTGVNFERVVADSREPSTRTQVQKLVRGKFDLIFIDGDHRYESVNADFWNWLPLLAPCGTLALHDICHRRMAEHDMWRFWQTRCGEFSASLEIYEPRAPWGGIGVGSDTPYHELPPFTYPAGTLEPPAQTLIPRCGGCDTPLDPEAGQEVFCPSCAGDS